MKSNKIKLAELKVKSFIVDNIENIKGGVANGRTYLAELCPTEDGIVCSGVLVCEVKEKREEEKERSNP